MWICLPKQAGGVWFYHYYFDYKTLQAGVLATCCPLDDTFSFTSFTPNPEVRKSKKANDCIASDGLRKRISKRLKKQTNMKNRDQIWLSLNITFTIIQNDTSKINFTSHSQSASVELLVSIPQSPQPPPGLLPLSWGREGDTGLCAEAREVNGGPEDNSSQRAAGHKSSLQPSSCPPQSAALFCSEA